MLPTDIDNTGGALFSARRQGWQFPTPYVEFHIRSLFMGDDIQRVSAVKHFRDYCDSALPGKTRVGLRESVDVITEIQNMCRDNMLVTIRLPKHESLNVSREALYCIMGHLQISFIIEKI